MFSEFKKSVNNIVNERLTSPLFGAFIISWLAWNWKIIYLTLFIDEKQIVGTKINFIITNYASLSYQIWYPLLSTLFLITVYPLLSTGAFWLNLKFTSWRHAIKNEIEKKQLLSIEQSLELREEITNQEERFDRLLQKKSEEIDNLKAENENFREQIKSFNQNISELPTETKTALFDKEYEALKSNEALFAEFQKIAPKAQRELTMFPDGSNINKSLFNYFMANDYIIKSGIGKYAFTEKGKYLHKLLLDEKYIDKK